MEVKLKISTDTLFALGRWFVQVNKLDARGLPLVWVTIGLELSDKFEKKCKEIQRKASLFDKKKHSYCFKFYQAWALKELLMVIVPHVQEENPLHFSLLTKLIHELDQKLL